MPSSLEYLLNRYADKSCTPEEREELMQLLQQPHHDAAVLQLIEQMVIKRETIHTMPEDTAGSVLQAILQTGKTPVIPIESVAPVRSVKWGRIAAAAIVLFLLGTTTYLWLNRTPHNIARTENPSNPFKNDVLPGGNKATLTLANGSSIILDSAANGTLAQQGNAKVLKTANGQLAYNTDNEKPAEVLYNTLATPRGGQYQLVLPDGSKVWLNAASSIRYPTAFTGKQRGVEITGEAYFEVAKNAAMPFMVKANGMEVKVLGTHFNVNAYDDETMVKTTLLEGAVRITKGVATAILKPGQQAQLINDQLLTINNADVEEAMAWKNGKLVFKQAAIKTIMRQAARWYDVEVVYKGKIEDTYTIDVPRTVPASQLFRLLEQSGGVHFIIEGKKITVTE
jgi:ferric-dicitrate binding protein FerR (iron transport regulator)